MPSTVSTWAFRGSLILLLPSALGCGPDPDCWVSDADCVGETCTTCVVSSAEGWVQCTDGFEVDWALPTGAAAQPRELTFDQALDVLNVHCGA